jgi:hypothetical protein
MNIDFEVHSLQGGKAVKFPDALAGSLFVAKCNAPIILSDETLSENECHDCFTLIYFSAIRWYFVIRYYWKHMYYIVKCKINQSKLNGL